MDSWHDMNDLCSSLTNQPWCWHLSSSFQVQQRLLSVSSVSKSASSHCWSCCDTNILKWKKIIKSYSQQWIKTSLQLTQQILLPVNRGLKIRLNKNDKYFVFSFSECDYLLLFSVILSFSFRMFVQQNDDQKISPRTHCKTKRERWLIIKKKIANYLIVRKLLV